MIYLNIFTKVLVDFIHFHVHFILWLELSQVSQKEQKCFCQKNLITFFPIFLYCPLLAGVSNANYGKQGKRAGGSGTVTVNIPRHVKKDFDHFFGLQFFSFI